ncbi:zinc-ribbon domain-containing protein [Paracoccus methylovorus]|uniref:Zinc-ribbon domain-containing protein n=1 Tax=Paracoccus methylovorus TaxID=2812658 RepID=A0ABX7JGD7_9RHOB|nr:zinc-ribbon domain-containing protein [Paracoccus methylovorus]QRZ12318.1 zinc-ribbon domain-containing protein [Paracoccus methylovorus]
MRLTCPRCAAQYEIAESAIPAAGREVECSSCGHVWRQPGPGNSAPPSQMGPRNPYDPEARPALSRQLDESVLAILRDEAARELRARETETRRVTPDHIRATADAQMLEAQPETKPESVDRDIDATAGSQVDWPALTVTGSSPDGAADAAPLQRGAEAETPDSAPALETPIAEDITKDPVAKAAPQDQDSTPPSDWQEPLARALPDAEELAATLTRTGPPQPGPNPHAGDDAGEEPQAAPLIRPAASEDMPVETAPPEAPVPAIVPAPRRTGYASGFGLAAMLALGVVLLYTLAPKIPAEEGGGLLAGWRQQIDHGRLWLHDRILGE